jgi:hypothetical protein
MPADHLKQVKNYKGNQRKSGSFSYGNFYIKMISKERYGHFFIYMYILTCMLSIGLC